MAPTATIASIAGCYECIEPQVGNMFKQETLRLPPQSAVLCKGYDPPKESLGAWVEIAMARRGLRRLFGEPARLRQLASL